VVVVVVVGKEVDRVIQTTEPIRVEQSK